LYSKKDKDPLFEVISLYGSTGPALIHLIHTFYDFFGNSSGPNRVSCFPLRD